MITSSLGTRGSSQGDDSHMRVTMARWVNVQVGEKVVWSTFEGDDDKNDDDGSNDLCSTRVWDALVRRFAPVVGIQEPWAVAQAVDHLFVAFQAPPAIVAGGHVSLSVMVDQVACVALLWIHRVLATDPALAMPKMMSSYTDDDAVVPPVFCVDAFFQETWRRVRWGLGAWLQRECHVDWRENDVCALLASLLAHAAPSTSTSGDHGTLPQLLATIQDIVGVPVYIHEPLDAVDQDFGWPMALTVFEFYLLDARRRAEETIDALDVRNANHMVQQQYAALMERARVFLPASHTMFADYADFCHGMDIVKIMDAMASELLFVEQAFSQLTFSNALEDAGELEAMTARFGVVQSSLRGMDDVFPAHVLAAYDAQRAQVQARVSVVGGWLLQIQEGWADAAQLQRRLQTWIDLIEERQALVTPMGHPVYDDACLLWMDALMAHDDDEASDANLAQWLEQHAHLEQLLEHLEAHDLPRLKQHMATLDKDDDDDNADGDDNDDEAASKGSNSSNQSLSPAETALIDMALCTLQLLQRLRQAMHAYGAWLRQLEARYQWEQRVAPLAEWLDAHEAQLHRFLGDALWQEGDLQQQQPQQQHQQQGSSGPEEQQCVDAELLVARLMTLEQNIADIDRGLYLDLIAAYQTLVDTMEDSPLNSIGDRQQALERRMDAATRGTVFARAAVEQHLAMLDMVAQFRHLKVAGEKLRRRLMLANDGLSDESLTDLAAEADQFKEQAAFCVLHGKQARRVPVLQIHAPSEGEEELVETTQAAVQSTQHAMSMHLALVVDSLQQLVADGHHVAALQRRITHTADQVRRLHDWLDDRQRYLEHLSMANAVASSSFSPPLSPSPTRSMSKAMNKTTTTNLFAFAGDDLPVLDGGKLARMEKERDAIASRLESVAEDELPKLADVIDELQDDDAADGHAVAKDQQQLLADWERVGRIYIKVRASLDRHHLQLDAWKAYLAWYDLGRKTNQWLLTNTKKLYEFCVKKVCFPASVSMSLSSVVQQQQQLQQQQQRDLWTVLRGYLTRVDAFERQMAQLDGAYQALNQCLGALLTDETKWQDDMALVQTRVVQKYRGLVHLGHYGSKWMDQRGAVTDVLGQLHDAMADADRLADTLAKAMRSNNHNHHLPSLHERVDAFQALAQKIQPNGIHYPIHVPNVNSDPALTAIFTWTRSQQEAHQAALKNAIHAQWTRMENARDRVVALLNDYDAWQAHQSSLAAHRATAHTLLQWIDAQLDLIKARHVDVALVVTRDHHHSDVSEDDDMLEDMDDMEPHHVDVIDDDDDDAPIPSSSTKSSSSWDRGYAASLAALAEFESTRWAPFQHAIGDDKDAFDVLQGHWRFFKQTLDDEAVYLGAWHKQQAWLLALHTGRVKGTLLRRQIHRDWRDTVAPVLVRIQQLVGQDEDNHGEDGHGECMENGMERRVEAILARWKQHAFWTTTVVHVQGCYDAFAACFLTLPRPMATPDHVVAKMDAWKRRVTRLDDFLATRHKEWQSHTQCLARVRQTRRYDAQLVQCHEALRAWWEQHAYITTWQPETPIMPLPDNEDDDNDDGNLNSLIHAIIIDFSEDHPLVPLATRWKHAVNAHKHALDQLKARCTTLCTHHRLGQQLWTHTHEPMTSDTLLHLENDISRAFVHDDADPQLQHHAMLIHDTLMARVTDLRASMPSTTPRSPKEKVQALLKDVDPGRMPLDECLGVWAQGVQGMEMEDEDVVDGMVAILDDWLTAAFTTDARDVAAMEREIDALGKRANHHSAMLECDVLRHQMDAVAATRCARRDKLEPVLPRVRNETHRQRIQDKLGTHEHDAMLQPLYKRLEKVEQQQKQQQQKQWQQERDDAQWAALVASWTDRVTALVAQMAARDSEIRQETLVYPPSANVTQTILDPLVQKVDPLLTERRQWPRDAPEHTQTLADRCTQQANDLNESLADLDHWLHLLQDLFSVETAMDGLKETDDEPLAAMRDQLSQLQQQCVTLATTKEHERHAAVFQAAYDQVLARVAEKETQHAMRLPLADLQRHWDMLEHHLALYQQHTADDLAVAPMVDVIDDQDTDDASTLCQDTPFSPPWVAWPAMDSIMAAHGHDLSLVTQHTQQVANAFEHNEWKMAIERQFHQIAAHDAFYALAAHVNEHVQWMALMYTDRITGQEMDDQDDRDAQWQEYGSALDAFVHRATVDAAHSKYAMVLCKHAWRAMIVRSRRWLEDWQRQLIDVEKLVAAGNALVVRIEHYEPCAEKKMDKKDQNDPFDKGDTWTTLTHECDALLDQLRQHEQRSAASSTSSSMSLLVSPPQRASSPLSMLSALKSTLTSTLESKRRAVADQAEQTDKDARAQTMARIDQALCALDNAIERAAPHLAATARNKPPQQQQQQQQWLDKAQLHAMDASLRAAYATHGTLLQEELLPAIIDDAPTHQHWTRTHAAYHARLRELQACIDQNDFYTHVAVIQSDAHHQKLPSKRKTHPPPLYTRASATPLCSPRPQSQNDTIVGKFWFGNSNTKRRLVYCRILTSGIVMVRVGGGWMEFSKFLAAHGCTEGILWKQKLDIGWQGVVTLRGGGGAGEKVSAAVSSSVSTSSTSSSLHSQPSLAFTPQQQKRATRPGFMDGNQFIRVDATGNLLAVKMTKAHDDSYVPYFPKHRHALRWT
ncbi:hypothetical protein BC940DRAFT_291395 [Gongronella butleri]|nr:hypothetical protein BC940DRAFT_291395 [Gongronella butleri]